VSLPRFIADRIRNLLITPVEELGRWQYVFRFLIEVCRHGVKQLREDRAGQIAAALAFRTIFGLIPVLVIAMVLFRAFGGMETFRDFVNDILIKAKLDEVVLSVGAEPMDQPEIIVDDGEPVETLLPENEVEEESPPGETVATWLAGLIEEIDSKISFRSIGLAGVFLLAWAAISLLTAIERSFNSVCRAPENRSLSRRLPLYWMTITFGPVLVYLSFHFGHQFDDWLVTDSGGVWAERLSWLMGGVTSFGSTWLFLLVLFLFMPNAKMRLGPVAFGAFVSALLWTVCTNLLSMYISTAFSDNLKFSILYGSLGLVPVFLIWVYFQWLIILFGLEIVSTLQTVGRVRLDDLGQLPDRAVMTGIVDPIAIVPLMQVLANRFAEGQTATISDLAQAIAVHEGAVAGMMEELERAGLVLSLEDDEDGRSFSLARPAGRIELQELIDLGHRLAQGGQDCSGEDERVSSSAWGLVSRLQAVQQREVCDLTLGGIVGDGEHGYGSEDSALPVAPG